MPMYLSESTKTLNAILGNVQSGLQGLVASLPGWAFLCLEQIGDKMSVSKKHTHWCAFKYFCGICWKKIKGDCQK